MNQAHDRGLSQRRENSSKAASPPEDYMSVSDGWHISQDCAYLNGSRRVTSSMDRALPYHGHIMKICEEYAMKHIRQRTRLTISRPSQGCIVRRRTCWLPSVFANYVSLDRRDSGTGTLLPSSLLMAPVLTAMDSSAFHSSIKVDLCSRCYLPYAFFSFSGDILRFYPTLPLGISEATLDGCLFWADWSKLVSKSEAFHGAAQYMHRKALHGVSIPVDEADTWDGPTCNVDQLSEYPNANPGRCVLQIDGFEVDAIKYLVEHVRL